MNNLNIHGSVRNNSGGSSISYNGIPSTDCFRLQPRHPMVAMKIRDGGGGSTSSSSGRQHPVGIIRSRKRGSHSLHQPAPAQEPFVRSHMVVHQGQPPALPPSPSAYQHGKGQPSYPEHDHISQEKQAPIQMISFVPSSASPRKNSSCDRGAEGRPATAQQRDYSVPASPYIHECESARVPNSSASFKSSAAQANMNISSPITANLDRATMTFQSLVLNSPRPSPSLRKLSPDFPQQQFSHQAKSSPFSASSRPPQATSLLPKTRSNVLQSSPPLNAAGGISNSTGGCGSNNTGSLIEAALYADGSGLSSSTPPHKTAPLRIVTSTPGRKHARQPHSPFHVSTPTVSSSATTRKRSQEDYMAVTPTAFKSPKATPRKYQGDEATPNCQSQSQGAIFPQFNNTPRSVAAWNNIQRRSARTDADDEDLSFASPLVTTTPLPSVALHPRSSGSSRQTASGEGNLGESGPRRSEVSAPSRVSVERTIQSPEMEATSASTSLTDAKSTRSVMFNEPGWDHHPDSNSTIAQSGSYQRSASSNSKADKPLTQSDVSFIPLPEWNIEEDPTSQQRQNLSFYPPSSLSLLRSGNRKVVDPFDQMIQSCAHSAETVAKQDKKQNKNGGMMNVDIELDSGSAEFSDIDTGFLLTVPRDIEEERQQAASYENSDRPSKAARRRKIDTASSQGFSSSGNRPSSTNEDSESSDNITPLLNSSSIRMKKSSSASTVSTRDLITPPAAMAHGNSPPPLLLHSPSKQEHFFH